MGGSGRPEEASSLYKLRGNWKDLVDTAEKISDMLGVTQTGFKKTLITDVQSFHSECLRFKINFEDQGPGKVGISATMAMQRMVKYKKSMESNWRRYQLYRSGEELFALRVF